MRPAAAAPAEAPLQPWWDARPSSAKQIGLSPSISMPLGAAALRHSHGDLGKPIGNPYPLELDIDQRRKWMDEHGVQMHVLTLNGGMPWQLVTPEEGVRLAQIVNDAGVEATPDFLTASSPRSSCRFVTLTWR
jgi:hypothetical protein